MPGLINAHTHIGDSIGKDISLNSSVDSRIHPVSGMKQKILKETPKKELIRFMRKSMTSMIKKGITTFIDFREGGLEGVYLLKKALVGLPIRSIILGRIEYYQTRNEIIRNVCMPKSRQMELTTLLENCDALALVVQTKIVIPIFDYIQKEKNFVQYILLKRYRAIPHQKRSQKLVNLNVLCYQIQHF